MHIITIWPANNNNVSNKQTQHFINKQLEKKQLINIHVESH